ncbi:hypothetical protein [Candidatus Albibeggiatoa sp. nov. NOAA]|uniref:hypothetical protein n=1 Tax=Candidatus Albibeggiatoa sp. nov. NOAA TaxID=3162724 RepID=UPI0032FC7303|nr:hypothetical protein [Thiotrichaceae bacterium]
MCIRPSLRAICTAVLLVPLFSHAQECNDLVYAVHDEGVSDSQFFTINPYDQFNIKSLGQSYDGYDIEGLDIHPETQVLYASSGNDTIEQPAGHLYAVDKQTGGITSIGGIDFMVQGQSVIGREVSALSYHSDGSLWGWAEHCGLLRIDEKTGESDLVYASGSCAGLADGLAVEDMSWDNTGEFIYLGVGNQVLVYEAETEEVSEVTTLAAGQKVEMLEMLPDGLLLVGLHRVDSQASAHLDLLGLHPETGRIEAELSVNTAPYYDVEGVAWSPCQEGVVSGKVTVTEGGELRIADRFVLNVPPNAVEKDMILTVQEVSLFIEELDESTGLIVEKQGLGSLYNLGPDGTIFLEPVSVELKYNPEALHGFPETELTIAHDGVSIETEVDKTNDLLKGQISHFSDVSIIKGSCSDISNKNSNNIHYFECKQPPVDACLKTTESESIHYKMPSSGECNTGDSKVGLWIASNIVKFKKEIGKHYELAILGEDDGQGTFIGQKVQDLAKANNALIAINASFFSHPKLDKGSWEVFQYNILNDEGIYETDTPGLYSSQTLVMDGELISLLEKEHIIKDGDSTKVVADIDEAITYFGLKNNKIEMKTGNKLQNGANSFLDSFEKAFKVDYFDATPRYRVRKYDEGDIAENGETVYTLSKRLNENPEFNTSTTDTTHYPHFKWALGSSESPLSSSLNPSHITCKYVQETLTGIGNSKDGFSILAHSNDSIILATFTKGDYWIGKAKYREICSILGLGFGMQDAITLDSGGSSQLYVKGEGSGGVAFSAGSGERYIATAIGLVPRKTVEPEPIEEPEPEPAIEEPEPVTPPTLICEADPVRTQSECQYSDVASPSGLNTEFRTAIQSLCRADIFKSPAEATDQRFRPQHSANHIEVLKVMLLVRDYNSAKETIDNNKTPWYDGIMKAAHNAGLDIQFSDNMLTAVDEKTAFEYMADIFYRYSPSCQNDVLSCFHDITNRTELLSTIKQQDDGRYKGNITRAELAVLADRIIKKYGFCVPGY